MKRSILRDAVQATPLHQLYFVVAQEAGIAVSSQRHNKSLNTGLAISSRSLLNTGYSQPVKQTLGLYPSNEGVISDHEEDFFHLREYSFINYLQCIS